MRDRVSILPLVAENIVFEISGRRLLDGVSFELLKGGVTAVIGPNGAGKSLTLRICHGLIAPTEGLVRWQENALSSGQKRHAMVFQRPVMLRRSALANLTHAVKAVGAVEAESRAADALARFGLSELAGRPARLLSGGEQQRLAIARAWALDPEMLFLDEPSSQLDPGATRQIEAMIANLASEGMTIMLATHDLAQARRLCQRVLFFHRGRIVEDAPAEQFWKEPSTAEGRAFIAGDLLW